MFFQFNYIFFPLFYWVLWIFKNGAILSYTDIFMYLHWTSKVLVFSNPYVINLHSIGIYSKRPSGNDVTYEMSSLYSALELHFSWLQHDIIMMYYYCFNIFFSYFLWATLSSIIDSCLIQPILLFSFTVQCLWRGVSSLTLIIEDFLRQVSVR